MKFDHHLHTARHSPDSIIDPYELVEHARRIGLDGIVITEHDYQWNPDELAELAARAAPLHVFSGVEVSSVEGHFLVYGLPSLEGVFPGIDLEDLLKLVRRHEAAIVAAHPYRWDQPFDSILESFGPAFDALELVSNNVTTETRERTAKALRGSSMAATGSSDAHEIATVGCYFTEISGAIENLGDFVAALRSRSVRPRHREGVRLTSGPVD
jgi:predicted metal-dependent phosphoesterase TrpH